MPEQDWHERALTALLSTVKPLSQDILVELSVRLNSADEEKSGLLNESVFQKEVSSLDCSLYIVILMEEQWFNFDSGIWI